MRIIAWVGRSAPLLLLACVLGGLLGFGWVPVTLPAALVAASCPAASAFATAVGASRAQTFAANPVVTAVLGSRGELIGRRLTVSTVAGQRSTNLAAESFASAAVGDVVVYGETVAAGGSRVGAIDVRSGCTYNLYSSNDVVRSAIVDTALRTLYVHAVRANSRDDLGVTRVDLASGAATSVLSAIAADARFGPTFATLLRWSVDDDALAVQSCGATSCRSRVVPLDGRPTETYAGASHGQIVGLSRGHLYVFAECPAFPCGLLAIDRRTGAAAALDVPATAAALGRDATGLVISLDTPAGKKEIRP